MQKQIASIYFSEVVAHRALYGGYYKIPVVAKGDAPFVLNVDDKIQRSQEPSPDGKTKVHRRDLINGRDIAHDILREWTRETVGMTPDCCPGMWIVRDEVPIINEDGAPQLDADKRAMWRAATPAERQAMWDEDLETARIANANWADYLIRSGDVLAEDPKQWVLIGPLMKTAARYFGKERPWLQELRDSDIKKCQWCTKTIPIQAAVCPNCQKIVDAVRYRELQRAQDELLGPVTPPPAANPTRQQLAKQ